jgi:hypothetical protein
MIMVLSASLGCIVLASAGVSVWSLTSWQAADNLKTYVAKLEAAGFTVETQPISNIKIDSKALFSLFTVFQNLAAAQNVSVIYLDSARNALYCLCCTGTDSGTVTANIFYYNPLNSSPVAAGKSAFLKPLIHRL